MSSLGDGGGAGGDVPPQTASAIVAEAVSGSHVLKIEGYSRTKGLGIGEFIASETFVVGGHRWCIRYYPDGGVSADADWIAMYLYRDDHTDGKDVMAKFMLTVLDQGGKLVSAYSETSASHRYPPKGGWGYNKFIKREDLEESKYLKDDCFSARCDVTVTKEIRTVPRTRAAPFVVVPPSDLHRHLLALLTSGQGGGDVTFEVGGETFAAHRYMLAARSSVFKAELFGPMQEKTATCVRVDDMEAKVFKAMLHFIYTDSLPPESDGDGDGDGEATEMAQHLLVAADRYNLERLKLICEETLCGYIGKSTAATTLALAEQHGCDGLKKACFEFLASVGNLKAVMASDGYEHLRSSCPNILEELVVNLAP